MLVHFYSYVDVGVALELSHACPLMLFVERILRHELRRQVLHALCQPGALERQLGVEQARRQVRVAADDILEGQVRLGGGIFSVRAQSLVFFLWAAERGRMAACSRVNFAKVVKLCVSVGIAVANSPPDASFCCF